MNKTRLLYASLLAIVIASCSTLSIGQGAKREWQTSACYRFSLTIRDKASDASYIAKYRVTATDGTIFVAEKKATDDDSARVVFPDNFHEEKTNQKAWINCNYGEKYKWAIYANKVLIDSGMISLTRNKQK